MTTFNSLVKKRKNCYEYSDQKISRENILKILETAHWSPSCANTQPWRFIIVTNDKIITKLIDNVHYFHQPFLHPLPPVIVAFVLDQCSFNNERSYCANDYEGRLIDAQLCVGMSTVIATLQATELGISSTILTPGKKSDSILSLSKDQKVILMMCLGYEKRSSYKKKRERISLRKLISYFHGS